MINRFYDPDGTLTLAQWRALDPTGNGNGPTRPVTDPPIGSMTDTDRSHQAFLSELVTDNDVWQLAGRANPTTPDIRAKDRARAQRRKAARLNGAGSVPVCPAEPRNDPTHTSPTPRTTEEHTP